MSKLSSKCVKESIERRTTKPHQLPIYATSSFELDSVEEGMDIFKDPSKGHLYGRFSNPTVDAVAEKIATIEAHGTTLTDEWGIMTSSGLSAITTLLMAELSAGDVILTQGNLYGGTTELIKNRLPQYGIGCILVDLTDVNAVKEALQKNKDIKAIYFETPSNPALDCIDLKKIAEIAKAHKVITVVDNTFCSPVVQRPFLFGIDYIIHSTTKYINGHGNSISGVMIGYGEERRKKVWSTMKLIGTNCNPFDAWLVNNGMKTLALRMKQHCSNALELAQFLNDHKGVATVNYLGLEDHRFHDLAKIQMDGFGGMMCFEVAAGSANGYEAGIQVMNALKIGSLAPTMGDVDTLIMHPASMSHLNVAPEIRAKNGISDSLIRVSVGIEDIEDLKEDFDRALQLVS